jgi:tRNA(adenine34) deaminase
MFSEQDHAFMRQALSLAKEAQRQGEVPVGAIVTLNNQIVGKGHNQPISNNDPSAHAEIQALRDAASNIENYRLVNATLYVTLEPCVMCAGAIIHARIAKVIYAATDPKGGAVDSVFEILKTNKLNHQVQCAGGLFCGDASQLLKDFFKSRR